MLRVLAIWIPSVAERNENQISMRLPEADGSVIDRAVSLGGWFSADFLRAATVCAAKKVVMHAGFVLNALEQAVHDRRPGKDTGLVHHSDRGSQYLSIRYTERLA